MPEWMLMAGGGIALLSNFLALLITIRGFKSWLKSAVLEPYVKPLKDSVESIASLQAEDRKTLQEHNKHIYMLLGKQFGGVPDLGDEPRTFVVKEEKS